MIELNKIYNEDYLELFSKLEDNSIDLIITDPPYLTTSRGNAGNSGGMMQKKINKKGQVFKHNNVNISDYAPEFYRVLKDGTHCYVMTNHKNLIEMLNEFTNAGFAFTKSLIWNKGNKIMGQFYMSQFEYILFFRKGKGKRINHCGTSDILEVTNKKTKNAEGKNIHDTEKPVELMKILIENSTKENEIVLDPFVGVGATAIASLELGRQFIGTELDEEYFDIANERLKGEIND